jgi:outer membrane protein
VDSVLKPTARNRRRVAALLGALLGTAMGPCADRSRAAGQPSVPAPTPADTLAATGEGLDLDRCIEIAVDRNLPLTIARHQRDAVETGVGAALGTWLPEFQLTSIRTSRHGDSKALSDTIPGVFFEETATDLVALVRQRLPFGGQVQVGYNFDRAGQDVFSGYGATVGVVQPLLRGAGWSRAVADVRDAHLAADGQQATLEAELLQVRFLVKSAYFEVVRRARLIEVNQRAIARDEQLRAFSEAKVEAKLATRRDVLSAEIILAQDRDRLVRAQTDYHRALDDLADVLGVPIRDSLDVRLVELQHNPVPLDADSWVEKARRDNPVLRRVRFDLERQTLSARVAGNARLPRVDLGLTYDTAYDPITAGDFPVTRRNQTTWQGSLLFSYPLFNKPLGNAYRAAKIRQEAARQLLEETERQVVLQVRDSVRKLQSSDERLGVLEKQIQGAREKVEFANVSFQLGRASNLDITDAQKDLVSAETDYVDEMVNYQVELAQLESILGGAFQ